MQHLREIRFELGCGVAMLLVGLGRTLDRTHQCWKRGMPVETLGEDLPERVHVGAAVDGLAPISFGRAVGRRTDPSLGDSKTGDYDRARVPDHDTSWGQTPMDQS
jgi:hypothetical protein